ncbi:MAG: hypothetical protein ACRDBX_06835 [Erysipelotrichaceae bacterium]
MFKKKTILTLLGAAIFVAVLILSSHMISESKRNTMHLAILNDEEMSVKNTDDYLLQHPDVEFVLLMIDQDEDSEYFEQVLFPNLYSLYPNSDFSKIAKLELHANVSSIAKQGAKNKFGVSTFPALVHVSRTEVGSLVFDSAYEWNGEASIDVKNLEVYMNPFAILVP